MFDSRPHIAQELGLPGKEQLDYWRSFAWVALALIVLLYLAGLAIRKPRGLVKALRKHVGA